MILIFMSAHGYFVEIPKNTMTNRNRRLFITDVESYEVTVTKFSTNDPSNTKIYIMGRFQNRVPKLRQEYAF